MTIRLHRGDLPADARFGSVVAIDTETLGLNPLRDRLCVIYLVGLVVVILAILSFFGLR